MKAITLWQPWASLIAVGAKTIETRSWETLHRGTVAIHAAKADPLVVRLVFDDGHSPLSKMLGEHGLRLDSCPRGAIVALADLVDCRRIYHLGARSQQITDTERLLGDYSAGRFCWFFENVRPVEPIPARGGRRIWNWTPPAHSIRFLTTQGHGCPFPTP